MAELEAVRRDMQAFDLFLRTALGICRRKKKYICSNAVRRERLQNQRVKPRKSSCAGCARSRLKGGAVLSGRLTGGTVLAGGLFVMLAATCGCGRAWRCAARGP